MYKGESLFQAHKQLGAMVTIVVAVKIPYLVVSNKKEIDIPMV